MHHTNLHGKGLPKSLKENNDFTGESPAVVFKLKVKGGVYEAL